MIHNKKGLLNGMIAFMFVLFFMAVLSIIATSMWTKTNAVFQGLDSSIASNETKTKINNAGEIMYYGDYFFLYTFIALLIGYLITASVSNIANPIYVIIFLATLIILTLIAMILSNSWTYILSNPNISEQENYKYTDFIMTYFPIITFFIAIIGLVIYFTRRNRGDGGTSAIGGDF